MRYDVHHHDERGLTYGLVRVGPKTYERCSRVPCCRRGNRAERQASEACRQPRRITDLDRELFEAMPLGFAEDRCTACGKPRWLCMKLWEEKRE
jgi:hypothetical protein